MSDFVTNNYRLFRKTIGQLKKLVKVVQFLKASGLFLSSKLPPLQNQCMQTAYSILHQVKFLYKTQFTQVEVTKQKQNIITRKIVKNLTI